MLSRALDISATFAGAKLRELIVARARNIKPSFFLNEQLGELDPLARLAFIGLWTVADYKGCVEYRLKKLKIQILPYDNCDFEQLMISLDKSGLISIYSVKGLNYIKIKNFEKHQNPHKNERDAGSNIPDITDNCGDQEYKPLVNKGLDIVENNREQDGTTPADSLFLNPDSLLLDPDSCSLIPDSSVLPNSDSKESSLGSTVAESLQKSLFGTRNVAPENKSTSFKTSSKSASGETWNAYASAYEQRYGAPPVRNSTINGQLAQFVKRIGDVEAPHVAMFYVRHNGQFYVKKMHAVGAMLMDAEKLRTEWATNRSMTETQARQTDRRQATGNVFNQLLEENRNGKL
jgi:hypothetical protein